VNKYRQSVGRIRYFHWAGGGTAAGLFRHLSTAARGNTPLAPVGFPAPAAHVSVLEPRLSSDPNSADPAAIGAADTQPLSHSPVGLSARHSGAARSSLVRSVADRLAEMDRRFRHHADRLVRCVQSYGSVGAKCDPRQLYTNSRGDRSGHDCTARRGDQWRGNVSSDNLWFVCVLAGRTLDWRRGLDTATI